MTRDEAVKMLQATRLMLMDGANQPISDLYYALDMAIEALEQTEPNCSEKPNNSKVSEIPTSSTISKMEQVEPQTERIKTLDYCDICNHKGCDNCIANNLDDYCVPSGYAPKDTPQTDCDTCRHYKLACELFSEICKYEPTTQIETQNSNLPFEKCEYCEYRYARYVGVCDMCELIGDEPNCSEIPNNCTEPTWEQVKEYCNKRCLDIVDSGFVQYLYNKQTEPQTCDDCIWTICNYNKIFEDEPQTYVINPQEPTNDDKCFECDDFFTCDGQCDEVEDTDGKERVDDCEKMRHLRSGNAYDNSTI